MKLKVSNIEFISFNDGICDIYYEEKGKEREYKYRRLGFTKRVLGFKRYFTAAANKMQINKVIRIPCVKEIDTYDTVEIDEVRYEIKLIQEIYDTNPPCIDLTLKIK